MRLRSPRTARSGLGQLTDAARLAATAALSWAATLAIGLALYAVGILLGVGG